VLAGSASRIRNPLAIPTATIDALLALGEVAARLPQTLEDLDRRVDRMLDDLSAMRTAVEPLDGRMQSLEREMRTMHGSLKEGMQATNDGMKETARLQDITNKGIGDLVEGVDPLEGGITKVEKNTASLPDQMGALQRLMSQMLEELSGLRESIQPVASAAEPVARLRERLPGGGD
jgi:predicted  nucleic acid-binding Zn-ribbon protein